MKCLFYLRDILQGQGERRFFRVCIKWAADNETEAMARNLGVMDATAFALCRDRRLPVKVFSIFKPGALRAVVLGADEGTLVSA